MKSYKTKTAKLIGVAEDPNISNVHIYTFKVSSTMTEGVREGTLVIRDVPDAYGFSEDYEIQTTVVPK